ncbi:KRAB-A domain-containing protein 2 [Plakobranchus ocellatus]|uniref:KRAB-A domain-containing protein 2 n=1 Tax=Plakobranchus ocellatus TaxID=259542 RepID=A0AAV4DPK2_9GAST|nr:KRAB-A domain-containing protein 2 [Plakobranchus ocellatus]
MSTVFCRYEVFQCGPTEITYKETFDTIGSPLCFVNIEETFDVVKSAHVSTGHSGRDVLLKELQKKHANIPTKAIELFKSLCRECQRVRKWPMIKYVVVHPIRTKEFSLRGQVDLVDMPSMPNGSNKKRICILRALPSNKGSFASTGHFSSLWCPHFL